MIYLNNKPINITMFPDNTSQVWKLDESNLLEKKAYVKWVFSHEGEVMHLAQLQDLLLLNGIETTLEITYLPYGRQDKLISNNSTFALETFLKIIRNFHFDKIIVHDPHNFDALRPGCAVNAVYPVEQVLDVIKETKTDIICYPDKGALNKYTKIYDFPYMYGEKVRDQLTGQITNYSIVGSPNNKNVLIVDDICDGGATFTILAKDLLASGAKSVVLFVTHGIFSKGTRLLFDAGIERVFTKDGEESKRSRSIQL